MSSATNSSSIQDPSYNILALITGSQNVENLKLVYDRYKFIKKSEFLNSLRRRRPELKADEKGSKLFQELSFDEQIKISQLGQLNQLEIFLKFSDKRNRFSNKRETQEAFMEQLKGFTKQLGVSGSDEVLGSGTTSEFDLEFAEEGESRTEGLESDQNSMIEQNVKKRSKGPSKRESDSSQLTGDVRFQASRKGSILEQRRVSHKLTDNKNVPSRARNPKRTRKPFQISRKSISRPSIDRERDPEKEQFRSFERPLGGIRVSQLKSRSRQVIPRKRSKGKKYSSKNKIFWEHRLNPIEKNIMNFGLNKAVAGDKDGLTLLKIQKGAETGLMKKTLKVSQNQGLQVKSIDFKNQKSFWKKAKPVGTNPEKARRQYLSLEKVRKGRRKGLLDGSLDAGMFKGPKKNVRKMKIQLANGKKGEAEALWQDILMNNKDYKKLKKQMMQDGKDKEDIISHNVSSKYRLKSKILVKRSTRRFSRA